MDSVTLRHVTRDDFELLATWLAAPHVWRWWHQEFGPEALERHFGPGLRGEEPAEDLIAEVGGCPVAHLQRSLWSDYPDELAEISPWVAVPEKAATIDYLVGEGVGLGIGPQVIKSFVADTWERYADCPAIIVPIAVGNRPSWRALEKVGFSHLGTAQLEPDNPIDPPDHVVMAIERGILSA